MFANARMYSIDATVATHWRALLEWVVARAGVPIEVIDYPPPQPLPALWQRTDAACVQMCGYPLLGAMPQPIPIAAVVPSPARYAHAPVYWTDLVVRTDGPCATPTDVLGWRMAYTSEQSQSGYQAVRRFFADYAAGAGTSRLFEAVIGPLVTPMKVVHAVIAGEVDVGPLDSYAHDLLRRHVPELAGQLRIIATTRPTPMPAFVAARGTPEHVVTALREALLAVAHSPAMDATRDALLIERFASVDAADYEVLSRLAAEADALGYPR